MTETFPKLAELRVGDKLEADSGFTCMNKGEIKVIESDRSHDLFVRCRQGTHYLNGQVDNHGEVIGLKKL